MVAQVQSLFRELRANKQCSLAKKKIKKERKEMEWDLHPREGVVKKGRFPHPGKSPHQ